MRDEQWRIQYPAWGAYPGADLTFGTLDTGYLTLKRPSIEYASTRTDDQEMYAEDGIRFGRDFNAPMTWSFNIGVDRVAVSSRLTAVLDYTGRLRQTWRADAVTHRPGAVAVLTQMYGGRQRMFYGRPRNFAVPETDRDLARQGYQAVMGQFACIDDNYYDPVTKSLQVDIVPASTGGLKAPLKAPLRSLRSTSADSVMVTTGTTWPRIALYGPGADLSVEFVGLFTVGIRGTIPYGEVITIDPRPWARSVTNRAGGGVAGRLTGVTQMANMRLPARQIEVVLRGVDATGTAKAILYWNDSHAYL